MADRAPPGSAKGTASKLQGVVRGRDQTTGGREPRVQAARDLHVQAPKQVPSATDQSGGAAGRRQDRERLGRLLVAWERHWHTPRSSHAGLVVVEARARGG